jgi:phosphohistidine phosphatase
MQLYLVQHGQAMKKDQDPTRPLTDEGRAAVQRAAKLASRLGVQVTEIRHSDKRRALQTAEELSSVLSAPRRQVSGLGPNDDINPLAREVASTNENLMIVGHLPFLGRLAAFLLCRDESLPAVEFQNAGIVRLDRREEGRWSLRWAIPPSTAMS